MTPAEIRATRRVQRLCRAILLHLRLRGRGGPYRDRRMELHRLLREARKAARL